MRRLILTVLIALPALFASAASAKDPTPPAGTWDLTHTRATYSGPPAPVRSALTKLIQRRVVFSPACTGTVCASYVTVKNARGQPVKFVVTQKARGEFSGQVEMRTGLRCGRRALKATLMMTVRMIQRQAEPGGVLTGTTEARAKNPGGCALFRGKARGLRKAWFNGIAANG